MQQPKRLEALQALRGFGAVLVTVMHCVAMASAYSGLSIFKQLASGPGPIGNFGVDIFFVLSGVIISILIKPTDSKPLQSPIGFALRRAAKIFPVFWITLVVMLILPRTPGADNSLTTLLAQPLSLALLEPPQAHPVGWTLVFEVHFYAVATLALFLGRFARCAALAWVPVQITLVVMSQLGVLPRYLFFDPISLELCLGLILGQFSLQRPLVRPSWFAAGSLISVVVIAAFLPLESLVFDGGKRLLLLGLPSALLVYAALSLDASGWVAPRLLYFLGEISYSLYMWHVACLLMGAILFAPVITTAVGATAYALFSFCITILVSWISFRLFERPITEWARKVTTAALISAIKAKVA